MIRPRPRVPALLVGFTALCLLAGLPACGGGDPAASDARATPQSGGIGGSGRMSASLVDAPACGFDAVNVTVLALRFHRSASARPGDAGWIDMPLAQATRVDLLALTGGAALPIGSLEVPPGRYEQMRLVLQPNDAASPLADSVVPAGSGTESPLATPAADSPAARAAVDVPVAAGQATEPQRESIEAAIIELKEAGVSKQKMQKLVRQLSI